MHLKYVWECEYMKIKRRTYIYLTRTEPYILSDWLE